MSAELLSSKPTYLLTWPAFAFRRWGNVLSVSVSVSVLCVSPGSSGRPWGLATQGQHRDTLGTVMKTPLGICRTLLVSEKQAWNENQPMERVLSLSNHAWTDQPWGKRNSESQRDCVCCTVLQDVGVNGLRITQTLPLCVCGASSLCLLTHMEGKLAFDESLYCMDGNKLFSLVVAGVCCLWCLFSCFSRDVIILLETRRVLHWHYLPCSWWGYLEHDHPDYHSSLQLSGFTLKNCPLKTAYL